MGGAGQAGGCVARIDPRLLDLEVEEEVEPTVAVDVRHVSLAVRLGAVALARIPGVSEADARRDNRSRVEAASTAIAKPLSGSLPPR